MDKYPIEEKEKRILQAADFGLTICLFFDFLLNLSYNGRQICKTNINKVDTFVVSV